MYAIDIPPIDFSPPWALDFEDRLAMLTRGRPRAAYYYHEPDTSTFRYRVYNICQTLAIKGRNEPSASWFHDGDWQHMDRVIDLCDVLVVGRVRYTDKVARMIALAHARGRRVLFDIDDFVFDHSIAHLIMDTLNVDMNNPALWDYWFSYTSRLGATLRLCDGAILTNAYLAARAEAFAGRPARVIPNYLNREQLEISDRIWREKQKRGWKRDGRILIGYFSGSPSHDRDFALVEWALARIMDEDDRVRLRIVGFLSGLGPELERHRNRVEILPLQDFLNLQRCVGEAEINLVPLQDNVFTNCKSELKWFEAAVVGTVTIATPTFTFREAITPEVNGWLAPSYAWESLLRTVIAEGEERWRAVASQARADAIERYAWDRQEATILTALFGS